MITSFLIWNIHFWDVGSVVASVKDLNLRRMFQIVDSTRAGSFLKLIIQQKMGG